jgi:hypothetical protein
MNECFDAGWLQSFFDGEFSTELMEQTARHIASCPLCAAEVREIENQQAIFMAALEPELSAAVPTERLRARIDKAIAGPTVFQKSSVAKPSWLQSFVELISYNPQRAAVFASIVAVLVLGSIFVAVKVKNGTVAVSYPNAPIARRETTPPQVGAVNVGLNQSNDNPRLKNATVPRPRVTRSKVVSNDDQIAGVRLIPGEKGYLKTIAALDDGLKQNGQRAIAPMTRAEYEQNLKLVDNAIAASRSKAKQNPRDPAAAEPMFAAYQSKIDLLNTMNEQARLTRQ